MGFYCNLCCFVAKSVVRAVLSRNFCHNLRAFMWRKIEPKKYICGEKMTNMRSATRALHREYELVQKLVPASMGVTHGQKIE